MESLPDLGRALRACGYRFVTPTAATIERVNARQRGASDPVGVFGWGRPFAADLLPPPWMACLRAGGWLRPHPGGGWSTPLRAATLDDALLFHTSGPQAADDAVFFGPDSYRFVRALAQELALGPRAPRRVLDLGCGAGAAALWLAARYPQAQVLGTDVNPAALRLCAANAALANVSNLTLQEADLLQGVSGTFDLIVADPPYIADRAGRTYRDGGGALGLALARAIVEQALDRLAPGGALLLYTGVAILQGTDPLRAALAARLDGAGVRWTYAEIDPDIFGEMLAEPAYAGADRIACVWLAAHTAPVCDTEQSKIAGAA